MIIPNLDFGGAQRSFCKVANELGKKHRVFVCVFNTLDGVAFEIEPELIDLNVRCRKHITWLSLGLLNTFKIRNKLKNGHRPLVISHFQLPVSKIVLRS